MAIIEKDDSRAFEVRYYCGEMTNCAECKEYNYCRRCFNSIIKKFPEDWSDDDCMRINNYFKYENIDIIGNIVENLTDVEKECNRLKSNLIKLVSENYDDIEKNTDTINSVVDVMDSIGYDTLNINNESCSFEALDICQLASAYTDAVQVKNNVVNNLKINTKK